MSVGACPRPESLWTMVWLGEQLQLWDTTIWLCSTRDDTGFIFSCDMHCLNSWRMNLETMIKLANPNSIWISFSKLKKAVVAGAFRSEDQNWIFCGDFWFIGINVPKLGLRAGGFQLIKFPYFPVVQDCHVLDLDMCWLIQNFTEECFYDLACNYWKCCFHITFLKGSFENCGKWEPEWLCSYLWWPAQLVLTYFNFKGKSIISNKSYLTYKFCFISRYCCVVDASVHGKSAKRQHSPFESCLIADAGKNNLELSINTQHWAVFQWVWNSCSLSEAE